MIIIASLFFLIEELRLERKKIYPLDFLHFNASAMVHGSEHRVMKPMDGRVGEGVVFTGETESDSTKKDCPFFSRQPLSALNFYRTN